MMGGGITLHIIYTRMQCVYRVMVYSAQKQNAYNPNKCDTPVRLGRRGGGEGSG